MAGFEDLQQALWDTDSDHGVQTPLTARAVLEAEALLKVSLPGTLIDLLRIRNGARSSTVAVPSPQALRPRGAPTMFPSTP